MTSLLRTLRRSESGQATLELALVLPVLLIVVIAIVDFGRAVNYWNDETHVANLAARYGIVGTLPNSTQDPKCGGQTTLAAYALCEAQIDNPTLANQTTVCVSVPSNTIGSPATIKVSAPYTWIPMPKVLGGSTQLAASTLSGTATMRLEQVMPSNWVTQTTPC